jgi:hypothetical protein
MTAIWNTAACSLVKAEHHQGDETDYEVVNTSETSVYFKEITCSCIPEGCHLLPRHRENTNLTSLPSASSPLPHQLNYFFIFMTYSYDYRVGY